MCTPSAGQNLIFQSFSRKKAEKIMRNEVKISILKLTPKHWLTQKCWGQSYKTNFNTRLQEETDKRMADIVPARIFNHFWSFFSFLHDKYLKSRFQPAFGVRSTQTLLKIYNKHNNHLFLRHSNHRPIPIVGRPMIEMLIALALFIIKIELTTNGPAYHLVPYKRLGIKNPGMPGDHLVNVKHGP